MKSTNNIASIRNITSAASSRS